MDQDNYRKEYREPKRKVLWDEDNNGNQRISTWIFGAFLIVIGAALAIEMNTNIDLPFLDNWWAIFIMYPGVLIIVGGWSKFRDNGDFFALFPGVFIFLLGLSFFAGIAITWVWAFFLIFLGISLILKK